MRNRRQTMAAAAAVLVGAGLGSADGSDKKKPVGATPPHPLDKAFEGAGAKNERAVMRALENNDHFRAAVRAAIKAHAEQKKRFDDMPKLAAPSPAATARIAFIRALEAAKPTEDKQV